MAKPFGNMAQLTGDILDSYIMGLQAGSTPDDAGLDEMKYVRVDKLRRYIREGLVTAYTPRENSSSATPSSPQVGDIFMCTGEFTESGVTYQLNHFYVYTAQLAWEDITAGIKGPKGDTGATPLLSIGEVTYGDTPNVTIDTTDPEHPVLDFVLKTSEVGVVDNLTSDSSVDALSAKQGRLLKQETTVLQSQIVNINSEVDNIEALIGDEAQVENVDDTPMVVQSRLIHHVNLLPNGEFGRVGARSVAWNNLIPNKTSQTINGITFTVDNTNRTITMIGTATADASFAFYPDTIGSGFRGENNHRYCITWDYFPEGYFLIINNGGIDNAGTSTSKRYGILFNVIDNTKGSGVILRVLSGNTINRTINILTLTDLTVIGLSSLSFDQFRALFPASSYPYDEGHIYDLNPTGFRIRGINLWDEETEVIGTTLCSKNYIPTIPSSTLYFLIPTGWLTITEYDIDKVQIGSSYSVVNNSHQLSANCVYIKFAVSSAYGTTYNNDIQICLDSLPTSIKTTYHPSEHHTVDTPQISDGHYVNENVYDYVENVVEDGVIKGKKHSVVGSVDLGTLSWTLQQGSDYWFYKAPFSGSQKYVDSNTKPNAISARYSLTNINSMGYVTNMISFSSDTVYCKTESTATTPTGVLYYELAAETITDVEPLRSFGISDYSTVEPITPQDELVNRIDVPFSVKSVSANTLIEQITQNTADIAEEKATRAAQVSALNKRVTNLELKTGDQFDVDYPSSTYGMNGVPSDVEPYAKVSVLKGVGRVANNLVQNGDFVDGTTGWEGSSVASFTASDGVATFTANAQNGQIATVDNITLNNTHFYLFLLKVKGTSANTGLNAIIAGAGAGSIALSSISATTSWQTLAGVFKPVNNSTTAKVNIYDGRASGWDAYQLTDVAFVDLNVYFNTSDLSFLGATDSAKLATIQQNYPELLEPSDYGTEAVFPTYTAVKSVGRNLWNEQWERGSYNLSTGEKTDYVNNFRNVNLIEVKANTTYYFMVPYNSYALKYDADGNYIGYTPIVAPYTVFTTEGNVRTINFTVGAGGASYANNICINVSDSQNGTYTPYMTATLTLPSPVTLKGAGSVAEQYYPETGRVTHPIGTRTYSANEVGEDTSVYTNVKYFYVNKPSNSKGNNTSQAYGFTTKYLVYPYYSGAGASNWDDAKCIGNCFAGFIYSRLYFGFAPNTTLEQAKAQIDGLLFSYELATPSADTYVDPLPDNYIKVEPNGTIEAVQSQSPEIDSAMTVEYMAS